MAAALTAAADASAANDDDKYDRDSNDNNDDITGTNYDNNGSTLLLKRYGTERQHYQQH